jgi:mercuric reductase
MMGQFVWLRPGVAMPDWSLVTADAARRALAAMAELEGLLARLANIEPLEDKLWRAVLEDYAETGRAPAVSEVADRTGVGRKMVQSTLRQLQARDVVVLDESSEAITGAYPFTERTTRHRVRLNAHRLNAMCAIDALGVGAMYGKDIEIESACHQCGRPIAIDTRDRGQDLATAVPDGTVVWIGLRYADKCAATSLCQVLAFFCSDEHLQSWRRVNVANGDDGMRLTLGEAMQVAKAHFMPLLAPAKHGARPLRIAP